jgi:hypothetical protein
MGLTPDELRLLLDVVAEEVEQSQDLYFQHENCDDSCSRRDLYRTRSEKAQQALDILERELNKE